MYYIELTMYGILQNLIVQNQQNQQELIWSHTIQW